MGSFRVEGVDERDNNWEHHAPRFRVYLHGSAVNSTAGWTDTYDIVGADVLQVLDWAQAQAGDILTFAVALVYDDDEEDRRNPGRGRGLVWLVGMDGNATPWDDADAETTSTQLRMLARRTAGPVQLSELDQMPAGVFSPYIDGTENRVI